MAQASIYKDIAARTDGDIYIGVVGPVRTGKSTFIKKFMEALVLPNMTDDQARARAVDEMPQSAAGKTVMTTEPKFVPDEAISVKLSGEGDMTVRVKMIDCVGYIIPDALGGLEDGKDRMVRTPWFEEEIPFERAAEIGTEKVIREHSTIGVVVTTDGTIGEIPRESYEEAERRVVDELKAIKKPFALILNSAEPETEEAVELALSLEEKYGVPVALVNCMELNYEDINQILELILFEFPVTEIGFGMPRWIMALERNHWLREAVVGAVTDNARGVTRIGDIRPAADKIAENEFIESVSVETTELGTGCVKVNIAVDEQLYYRIMGELTGFEISGEEELITLMRELSHMKRRYDKVEKALNDVYDGGYGIVMPDIDELRFEDPEIVRTSGSFGVRLRAGAPSIHMIRADIETELNPIVGTEEQSEDMVKFLREEYDDDPKKIWDSNMFGKSLQELVNEGLNSKLENIPEEARQKLSETLERILNEGSNGLICILL